MARGTREPLCYCRLVRPVPCARSPPAESIVLDIDSSVSPTHGEQEMSVWNGHYACTCYHPLFVFNQFGDLERCALRPGNVHSADSSVGFADPIGQPLLILLDDFCCAISATTINDNILKIGIALEQD
jgi:Transposase DDE domain group 1